MNFSPFRSESGASFIGRIQAPPGSTKVQFCYDLWLCLLTGQMAMAEAPGLECSNGSGGGALDGGPMNVEDAR